MAHPNSNPQLEGQVAATNGASTVQKRAAGESVAGESARVPLTHIRHVKADGVKVLYREAGLLKRESSKANLGGVR